MEYTIIKPQTSLKFLEMENKELKAYYEWFMEQIPFRINILQNYIKHSKGYEYIDLDYMPESLEPLSVWFSKNVQFRNRTEAEIKDIYDNSPDWFKKVEIDTKVLTDKSISLAFDVAMYLGEVFVKNNNNVKWIHNIKTGKRNADRGQPVLIGFGKVPLNPVDICIVIASKFVENVIDEKYLKTYYDRWVGYIVDK